MAVKRLLVALVAAAFASPFVATPDVARGPEPAATAVRAVSDAPEAPASAHRADAGRSELALRDPRTRQQGTRQQGTRPGDQQASPEFGAAGSLSAGEHARSTGLRTSPVSARALAFPFYATAPPGTRVSA